MKFSQLKGMPVISVAAAGKLGSVDNLLIDPTQHRVLGILVKPGGLFVPDQAVLLDEVKAIGLDAVTVEDASRIKPQETVPELKDQPSLDAVLGSRVMTEHGTNIGTVRDVDVDLAAGRIMGYILNGGVIDRLRGQEHYVTVAEVRSIGPKLIVVMPSAPSSS